MTGNFRALSKDEIMAASGEDTSGGLASGTIECAAVKCLSCLQRRLNDLEARIPEEQAVFDEMDLLMNEREPIFGANEPDKPLIVEGFKIDQIGDTYKLLFRITDPNKRVKKFDEMAGKE